MPRRILDGLCDRRTMLASVIPSESRLGRKPRLRLSERMGRRFEVNTTVIKADKLTGWWYNPRNGKSEKIRPVERAESISFISPLTIPERNLTACLSLTMPIRSTGVHNRIKVAWSKQTLTLVQADQKPLTSLSSRHSH